MRAFLRALSFRMLALALILTLLAAPQALAATKYATLEFGSRGSDVLKLQKALLELGFNPNGTDGKFGRGTETAVKAYQAARGLEADGKAGTLTLTKLYAETDGQSATVTTPVTTNPNTLKYGDSGSRVTELQTALVKLGYNTNGVDGRFGAGTQRAVISFQKDNGLEADGLAGTKTLELLYKKADGTSSSSGSSSTATTTTSVNLRAKGTTASDKLGTFAKGTKVTVLDKGSSWSKVEVSGKTGYTKEWTMRFENNLGVFRIRLAGFGVDCMPRMIVGLVNHQSNE